MGRRAVTTTGRTPTRVVMPESSPERFALGLLEAVVALALVAVPLYFNPLTDRVFEPDKLAWVLMLGLTASWALVVVGVERWRRQAGTATADPSSASRSARFHVTPIGLAVTFTAVVLVVGTLVSVVPLVSLWGVYRRGQGLWVYLAFIGLCAATAIGLGGPRAVSRVRRALLLPVLPVAIYALLQRAGIDSVPWQTPGDTAAVRAFGPLGNPIFLGAWLVLVLPLALAGLLESWTEHRTGTSGAAWRIAGHALILALGLAALLASQSRGPALGLMVGLGFFALLWAAVAGRRRLAMGLLGAALVVGLGLVVFGRTGGSGAGRLGGLLDPASRTARERVLVWQALGDMATADPARAFLGYGPDTLMYTLPAFAPKELVQLTPGQTFDRAHNVLWEWWTSAGLLGVLALLGLYVAAFVTGFRLLGLTATSRGSWSLAGAMVAGAALGVALPIGLGATPYTALGLPAGLLAGALVFAVARKAPGTATTSIPTLAVIAVLAALAGHLVEGALGLPTAAGELAFWVCLGLLATWARPSFGTNEAPAPAWAGGLVDGLALATVAGAPLLQPDPKAALGTAWPLWLLPLSVWIIADLLAPPARTGYGRVVVARLAVLGGFAVVFAALAPRTGGTMLAYAVMLGAVTAVMAWALARARGQPPAEAQVGVRSRWAIYAALAVLATAGTWRLAVTPVLADAHLRAGLRAAVDGNGDQARAHFNLAAALWPEQPAYGTYVAAGYRDVFLDPNAPGQARVDSFQKAKDALQRALAIAPDDVVLLRLATLYRDKADRAPDDANLQAAWAQAEHYYALALVHFPLAPATLVGHGELQERIGALDPARTSYQSALDLDPANLGALSGLVRANLAAGDVAAANTALEKALAIQPNKPEAVAQALSAGTASGDTDLATERARVLFLVATGARDQAATQLDTLLRQAPADVGGLALRTWLNQHGIG